MAISTRLGRCYRCSCRCSAHRIREQGAQGRQRGQGRNRLRRRARGSACTGIEHPGRDLLRARDGRVHETAARRCARRSLDHLVKANWAPSPGMPGVDNRDLVASCRTMGLVVRSCIIGSACTQPWAIALQPKPGPAWRRSRCARQPDLLIAPLHSQGGSPIMTLGDKGEKARPLALTQPFTANLAAISRNDLCPACAPASGSTWVCSN
jgi:hypothetical protein